jgi:hypothetical protein
MLLYSQDRTAVPTKYEVGWASAKLDVLEGKNLLLLSGIQPQIIQPTKESWLYCIILLF